MFCPGLETIQVRRLVSFEERRKLCGGHLGSFFTTSIRISSCGDMLHAMFGVNGTLKMRLGFSVSGSAVRLLQSKDTRSLR